jgi:non-ribosomal peptide synthetase component F
VLVDAWLPRAAERHPDRPAVNALTYAELLGEVDATARRLAGRGVRAGDRVGIAWRRARPSASPCTRSCAWARSRSRWTCA